MHRISARGHLFGSAPDLFRTFASSLYQEFQREWQERNVDVPLSPLWITEDGHGAYDVPSWQFALTFAGFTETPHRSPAPR